MSVLIKNATIPKCCDDCNLESYCNLWTRCRNEEERHPDCPLIELQPHGRLGDLDELFRTMENKGWFDNADRDIAEDIVLDAPTIIEAEGEA